jgi:nucleoside-diphosphate-sugar epimerase
VELKGLKVAVTGATGFIGRYICAELLQRGADVICVVRNPDRVPALQQQGVSMRKADLSDVARLQRGFDGADAVTSNAALFKLDNADWQEHEKTNIQGSRNVLQAAHAAGVKRVIVVSSCGVYASLGRGTPSETAKKFSGQTRRNRINRYMVSKALAEQEAWEIAGQNGLNMTAVRPSAVYGAHDSNFMPRLLKVAGMPLSLPTTGFSFVYAGDVAIGICDCLANDHTIGKAYNLAGEDRPLGEFIDALRDAYGIKVRFRLPLPIPFRNTFDHSLAAREIGFSNRSFAAGLEDTRRLEALD